MCLGHGVAHRVALLVFPNSVFGRGTTTIVLEQRSSSKTRENKDDALCTVACSVSLLNKKNSFWVSSKAHKMSSRAETWDAPLAYCRVPCGECCCTHALGTSISTGQARCKFMEHFDEMAETMSRTMKNEIALRAEDERKRRAEWEVGRIRGSCRSSLQVRPNRLEGTETYKETRFVAPSKSQLY